MRQFGCDPGLHACIGGRGGQQPRPQTMPRRWHREPHRRALESLEDVLAVPEGHERPPWQQAYAHLRDNTLDRGQRAFAWQLLHAALVPRAARMAHDDRLGPTEGVCTHPNCVRVPETITHVLLECPLAVSVVTWLRDLWDAVTGGGNGHPTRLRCCWVMISGPGSREMQACG